MAVLLSIKKINNNKGWIQKIKDLYSSGYGGSGKSSDPHSQAANVTFAMWGPYKVT